MPRIQIADIPENYLIEFEIFSEHSFNHTIATHTSLHTLDFVFKKFN